MDGPRILNSLTSKLAKLITKGKSRKPFRRFIGSLTLLGFVSTGSTGCAQENQKPLPVELESGNSGQDSSYDKQSQFLIEGIKQKGVKDEKVLRALASVPRHIFVADDLQTSSYDDNPLPIGQGQTISQPFIVAYMTEALGLNGAERVLEIGTGSGYQAAVLSRLAKQVYSIEIIPELAARARTALTAAGITNVHQKTGDGYQGWSAEAPFDAIIVTAAPPAIPPKLIEQLKVGGKLIAPVGENGEIQWLIRLTKKADGSVNKETLIPVRFVPMVPAAGAGAER
jgi:protein-L-isoaspartate(D-aspartate) O-methyltransferase